MRTYQLQTSLWLPQPRQRIFGFFSDPKNLERITPPWLHFEILSPIELAVDCGTRIDYRLRIRGLQIRWQSEIIIWEPPTRFVDQQTRGPYRLWVHEHTFSEREGGTIAGDNVVYAVPGGKLVQKIICCAGSRQNFPLSARSPGAYLQSKKVAAHRARGTIILV